jgi:hypothetical protein
MHNLKYFKFFKKHNMTDTRMKDLKEKTISANKCPRPVPFNSKEDAVIYWMSTPLKPRPASSPLKACDFPIERFKMSIRTFKEHLEQAKRKCVEKKYACFVVYIHNTVDIQANFFNAIPKEGMIPGAVLHHPMTPRVCKQMIRSAKSCTVLEKVVADARVLKNASIKSEYTKRRAALCGGVSAPAPTSQEVTAPDASENVSPVSSGSASNSASDSASDSVSTSQTSQTNQTPETTPIEQIETDPDVSMLALSVSEAPTEAPSGDYTFYIVMAVVLIVFLLIGIGLWYYFSSPARGSSKTDITDKTDKTSKTTKTAKTVKNSKKA